MLHSIRVFLTYLDLLQNFIKTLKSRGGTVKGTLLMSELLDIVSPFLYDNPAKNKENKYNESESSRFNTLIIE